MIRQKKTLAAFLSYTLDIFITVISFVLAYWVRNTYLSEEYGGLYPFRDYFWFLLFIVPLWSLLLYYFKTDRPLSEKSLQADFWIIFKVVFCGSILLGLFIFLFKLEYASRLYIGSFVIINFVLLSSKETLLRYIANYFRKSDSDYYNILIVGTQREAMKIAKFVEEHKDWGFRIIGFVADSASFKETKIAGHRVIGKIENISDILFGDEHVIDEIIFAMPRHKSKELKKLLLLCEELGINTRVVADFFSHRRVNVYLENFHDVPLLTFSAVPNDLFSLFIKRVLDVLVSLLLLLTFSLPLIVVSLLIKLTSKGPILFKQTRVGLNGRPFILYKFRSMVEDAEKMKKDLNHLNKLDGPVFKIESDPRITKIGAFIRKTSIDEFPQFFNVLKGEMSIVGPRPPLPEEVKQYDDWHRRKLSMSPGITCTWQIRGRDNVKFNRRMELELQYIDDWSLLSDLKIFFKTIPVVLFKRGAS